MRSLSPPTGSGGVRVRGRGLRAPRHLRQDAGRLGPHLRELDRGDVSSDVPGVVMKSARAHIYFFSNQLEEKC